MNNGGLAPLSKGLTVQVYSKTAQCRTKTDPQDIVGEAPIVYRVWFGGPFKELIVTPKEYEFFEVGKEYNVTFTPIP